MRKTLKYISGFAVLALLFSSCTERIDIDLDSTYTRLIVNGKLSSDSLHHQVLLTTTSDYFSNAPAPTVSGALVELSFDDQSIRFVEQDTMPGLYLSPEAFRGVIGTEYRLRISDVDVDEDGSPELYESTATMPGGLVLDSIYLEYFDSYFVSGYQMYMFALDPPGPDWYSLRFLKNNDLLTDTLIKYSVQSDDFYDGGYLFYGIPMGFFNDEEEREVLMPGDTASLEILSIEEDYYSFVNDAQLEIFGSNPLFSGPPANIRTNISNGALGFFAVYSIERASYILPEPGRK